MINLAVILNGPIKSGKSFLATGVKEALSNRFNVHTKQFKYGLFELVKKKHGQKVYEDFIQNQDNHEWKSTPLDCLSGRSPREELIYISEVETKPVRGKHYFARALIDSFTPDELNDDICLMSDGGFVEEIQELLYADEIQHVLLVHLYSEGCTFQGDSRNYVLEDDLYPPLRNLTVVPFYNLKAGKQDIDNLSSIIQHVWKNNI